MEYRNNSFDTSIKDLEACERPREKMSLYGPQKLSDFELICIMLGSGSRNYPVNVLAKQILKVIDKVGDSRPLELESLESIPGWEWPVHRKSALPWSLEEGATLPSTGFSGSLGTCFRLSAIMHSVSRNPFWWRASMEPWSL